MTWLWQRQSLTITIALKRLWKQILNMLMWNLRTNTPTTVPAAEIPAPTPAPQAPAQSAPATQSSGSNSYVPTTTPVPESMQNVVPSTQQAPRIEVKPAESVDRSTLVIPGDNSTK